MLTKHDNISRNDWKYRKTCVIKIHFVNFSVRIFDCTARIWNFNCSQITDLCYLKKLYYSFKGFFSNISIIFSDLITSANNARTIMNQVEFLPCSSHSVSVLYLHISVHTNLLTYATPFCSWVSEASGKTFRSAWIEGERRALIDKQSEEHGVKSNF